MPTTSELPLLIPFFLVAGIQIIYWCYFIVGTAKLKSTKTVLDTSTGISVIVAARNQLDQLKVLLPTLLAQNHQNFEIIIVNDRSNDGTLEFLSEKEDTVEQLKVLHVHDLPDHITGKKYALTLGIKAAKNKNLVFTDADCKPASESWLSSMAGGFSQGAEFVLGFSGYAKVKGFLNYFIRFETLLTGIQYLAAAANKMPYMGVGRNLGYKKDVFIQNKGFLGMQHLIGGDDDLFVNKYAKGRLTSVVVGQNALIESEAKTSWSAYLNQKHRHLSVGKSYSFASKFFLGLFNISWIFTYVLAILALLFHADPLYLGVALLLRLTVVLIAILFGTKRLEIPFLGVGVIVLDLVYPIYYIFAGIKALFIKRISWE